MLSVLTIIGLKTLILGALLVMISVLLSMFVLDSPLDNNKNPIYKFCVVLGATGLGLALISVLLLCVLLIIKIIIF